MGFKPPMTKQGCAFPTVGAARGITMAMGGGVVSRHVGGSPGKAGPGGGVTETSDRRGAGDGSAATACSRRGAGAVATPAATGVLATPADACSAAIAGSRRFVLMNVVVGTRCGGGGVLIIAWASATATDDCGIAVRRAIK